MTVNVVIVDLSGSRVADVTPLAKLSSSTVRSVANALELAFSVRSSAMAGAVMAARVAVAMVVVTTVGLSRAVMASSARRSALGRCSFMMEKNG